MSPAWQDLVADKKQRQTASIPRDWLIALPPESVRDVRNVPEECGLLSSKELEITNTVDVELILRNLAIGKWSAVEVTLAFYKRAIVAQQLVSHHPRLLYYTQFRSKTQVNCLTEIFVERALARAKELDDRLQATGKVVGPLHGLPISLKDQLAMKGLETTMGMQVLRRQIVC